MDYHVRNQFRVANKDAEIPIAELNCYHRIAAQLIGLNGTKYTVEYTISIIPHEFCEELNYVQIDAIIKIH